MTVCPRSLQGGFDAGFLYHCKFSVEQDQDFNQQQDEPFDFLPVDNAENDPICSITFRYCLPLFMPIVLVLKHNHHWLYILISEVSDENQNICGLTKNTPCNSGNMLI